MSVSVSAWLLIGQTPWLWAPWLWAIWIPLCGGTTGVASMLLYARFSPQSRVAELSVQAASARQELHRFDGSDVRVVWSLIKRAVGLSLRHIGLILFPTLAAAMLVLGIAGWVDAAWGLGGLTFSPEWAPAWLFSGHAAFWVPLCLSAMLIKWGFGIK